MLLFNQLINMNNLSIIVAVGKNLEIGKDNKLLWHISEDLKHFKTLTLGQTVVMGENTWYSLPKHPLPNRKNIVLSHNEDLVIDGANVFSSIDDFLDFVKTEEKVFIIGGASIYSQFIDIVDTMYITRVDMDFEADTFFPDIYDQIWNLTNGNNWKHDAESNLDYCFETYHRK